MKELSSLKKLAEAAGQEKADLKAGSAKVFKMFNPLVDKIEKAYDFTKEVSEALQSAVLSDLLKAEGFPATESKAAKSAAEKAFQAVREANEQVLDLLQALGMHFTDPADME